MRQADCVRRFSWGAKLNSMIDVEIAPGIRLTAESPEDLLTFIERELALWKTTKEIKTRHPDMLHRAYEQQQQHLENLRNTAAEFVSNPSQIEVARIRLRVFDERADGQHALCSLNPRDAAVLALKDIDPDAAAAGMAARLRNRDVLRHINDVDKADVILALGRYASATATPAVYAVSLASHVERVDSSIRQWRGAVDEALQKAAQAIQDSSGALAAFQQQASSDHKAHEGMLADHDKAVQELVKRYMTEMTLRAPVQYWNDLAGAAKTAASRWLIAFIAVGGLSLWAIAKFGPDLLALLKDSKGDVSLVAVPLLIAAVIPVFWMLKHIARLFADNIADARDAKQRASLTSTFLALTAKEGVEFTEAERAIIVQALFRPSPAQPSDDGIPVPVLELLKPK